MLALMGLLVLILVVPIWLVLTLSYDMVVWKHRVKRHPKCTCPQGWVGIYTPCEFCRTKGN